MFSFRSHHYARCAQLGVLLAAVATMASVIGLGGPSRATADQGATAKGFQDFLFFTNFETLDPELYSSPAGCAGRYYSEWVGKYSCIAIADNGTLEGPVHTNDAAQMFGHPSFGRPGVSPPDTVEIYGGTYPEDGGEQCTGSPVFHTATGCYVKGERMPLPEGDESLAASTESGAEFSGETRLELDGASNTIRVTSVGPKGEEAVKTIGWPANGLLYVKATDCGWPTSTSTEAFNADGVAEAQHERGCGNVYVRGTYSRSLSVAAEDDVIINGSVYPTSVTGNLGQAPTGTATLGLVAGNDVRIYHPVSATGADRPDPGCTASSLDQAEDPNKWGSQPNIWIYAAILAIGHTFIVDNYGCGPGLGLLNVYGSIAIDYRGPVGTGSEKGRTGYEHDYKYDDRLAADPPPFYPTPAQNSCPSSGATPALSGANGARRKPFVVKISALGIREITFALDGRSVRSLNTSQARDGHYAVTLNPRKLSNGPHTVSVTTVMDDASCPSVIGHAVFVHPRPPHVAPTFTG